jgi:hypothetical protein
MKLLIAAGVLAVLAGSGLYVAGRAGYGPMVSTETAFLMACDEVIKDRLRSPASYQRVSATPFLRRPADILTYMQTDTPEKFARAAALDASNPDMAKLRKSQAEFFKAAGLEEAATIIAYDAANGFGTLIRSEVICSDFIRKDEPVHHNSVLGPRVDNLTKMDWTIESLREFGA